MIAFGLAGTHREKAADIVNEETGPLIKTEEGSLWVSRELVLIQHVFHPPQVIAGNLSDTPLFT